MLGSGFNLIHTFHANSNINPKIIPMKQTVKHLLKQQKNVPINMLSQHDAPTHSHSLQATPFVLVCLIALDPLMSLLITAADRFETQTSFSHFLSSFSYYPQSPSAAISPVVITANQCHSQSHLRRTMKCFMDKSWRTQGAPSSWEVSQQLQSLFCLVLSSVCLSVFTSVTFLSVLPSCSVSHRFWHPSASLSISVYYLLLVSFPFFLLLQPSFSPRKLSPSSFQSLFH